MLANPLASVECLIPVDGEQPGGGGGDGSVGGYGGGGEKTEKELRRRNITALFWRLI